MGIVPGNVQSALGTIIHSTPGQGGGAEGRGGVAIAVLRGEETEGGGNSARVTQSVPGRTRIQTGACRTPQGGLPPFLAASASPAVSTVPRRLWHSLPP